MYWPSGLRTVEKGGYQTSLILYLFGKKVHLTRNVLWNNQVSAANQNVIGIWPPENQRLGRHSKLEYCLNVYIFGLAMITFEVSHPRPRARMDWNDDCGIGLMRQIRSGSGVDLHRLVCARHGRELMGLKPLRFQQSVVDHMVSLWLNPVILPSMKYLIS